MFETSSSSSSLLSNGSSRSSQTDDLVRSIEGYAEEADQQLEEALRNQEDVAADIKILIQLLRQVGRLCGISGQLLIVLTADRRAREDQPGLSELEAAV